MSKIFRMRKTDVKIGDTVKILINDYNQMHRTFIVARIDLRANFPFGFWNNIMHYQRQDFEILNTKEAYKKEILVRACIDTLSPPHSSGNIGVRFYVNDANDARLPKLTENLYISSESILRT